MTTQEEMPKKQLFITVKAALCKFCGKKFPMTHSKRKFCSQSCAGKYAGKTYGEQARASGWIQKLGLKQGKINSETADPESRPNLWEDTRPEKCRIRTYEEDE